MQKPALAIALLAVVATPASFAQRGGSAGRGGGFVSHAAPFHSAPAFTGYSAFTAPTHIANFAAGIRSSQRPPIASSFRGAPFAFRANPYRHPYLRSYPIAYPYAATGWLDPGYLDPGIYGDLPAPLPSPQPYVDDVSNEAPPQTADQQAAAPVFRPAYIRPQPELEPATQTAVTLIFKDGRPTEQIHNYMLTRTTLYVQDQHMRQIAVDQLDLAATEKANLDAGVDFRLPAASR